MDAPFVELIYHCLSVLVFFYFLELRFCHLECLFCLGFFVLPLFVFIVKRKTTQFRFQEQNERFYFIPGA